MITLREVRLMRLVQVLRSGNPYHDDKGRFSAGPGDTGRRKRRQSPKAGSLGRLQAHYNANPVKRWPDILTTNPKGESDTYHVEVVKNAYHYEEPEEKRYYARVVQHSTGNTDSSEGYNKRETALKAGERLHKEYSQPYRSLERFNPNHEPSGSAKGGQFTSSKWAGHSDVKAFRKEAREEVQGVHESKNQEITELKKDHRQSLKDMAKEHVQAVKDMQKDHADELKQAAKDQAKEVKDLEREQAKELAKEDKDAAKHRETMQGEDFDNEDREAAEKELAEDRAKLVAEHAEALQDLKESYAEDVKNLKEDHAQQIKDLEQEQADEVDTARSDLAEAIKGVEEDRKAELKELAERLKSDYRELIGQLEEDDDEERSFIPRSLSLGPLRVHKASSAESILGHCLKCKGWTRAHRQDELTGPQRLELLEEVRLYARAWLRHEGEQFTRLYLHGPAQIGRNLVRADSPDYSNAPIIQLPDRSLRGHIGRFFKRVKNFVAESVFAGVMALLGPSRLTAQEIEEADKAIVVQEQYLDRFERQILETGFKIQSEEPVVPGAVQVITIEPPPGEKPIDIGPSQFPITWKPYDPTKTHEIIVEPPMSTDQFVARVESYGNAAWQGTQQVNQKVAQGVFKFERRVLGIPKTQHCEDCPPLAAMGWQPLGSLPAIGDTECNGACLCSFRFRESEDGQEFFRGKKGPVPAPPIRPKETSKPPRVKKPERPYEEVEVKPGPWPAEEVPPGYEYTGGKEE